MNRFKPPSSSLLMILLHFIFLCAIFTYTFTHTLVPYLCHVRSFQGGGGVVLAVSHLNIELIKNHKLWKKHFKHLLFPRVRHVSVFT